jgi:hypothetical protein
MLFFAPGTFYYRIFLFVNAFPQTAKGSFSAVFDNPDGKKKGSIKHGGRQEKGYLSRHRSAGKRISLKTLAFCSNRFSGYPFLCLSRVECFKGKLYRTFSEN